MTIILPAITSLLLYQDEGNLLGYFAFGLDMFSVLQSLLTGYKKVLLKGFGAYTTQFKDVLVEVNLANYSIISMACSMICWHIQFLFSLVCHLLRSSEICSDQCKLGFPFGHTVPCSYIHII
jgi:hypothetical protein